jgi:hypothetical protein
VGLVKLVAIVKVNHGQKKDPRGTVEVVSADPGESFDIDPDTAKILIANGSAATPEDYERAKAATKPAGERMAELEAENAQLREDLAKAKK